MDILYHDMARNALAFDSKLEELIQDSERLAAVIKYVKKSTYIEKDMLLALSGADEQSGKGEAQ